MKGKINKPVWIFVLLALLCSIVEAPALDYIGVVTNTPNLLAYWQFDPVFQTNSCVNGFTGTLQGNAQIGAPGSGVPLSSDPGAEALLLDGSNSYFTTTLIGEITNQGTVLVWVYLTAQPSTAGHIFEITSQSQEQDDFDFQIETDNNTYFFTDSGSSTVYTEPLPLNQWQFLAATFIANSNRCIYLNGQLAASSTAGPHSVNNTEFWIGNDRVFGPRLFEGRIDEVAVFNRALAASEIAAVYSAALGPPLNIAALASNVILAWPTNFPTFLLQTNASLDTTNWGTIPTPYTVNSTNYSVTSPIGVSTTFYRLISSSTPME